MGAGHDVLAVSEIALGATDDVVMDLARHVRRVLITEDKDFGQLVFAAGLPASGVIFVRYPVSARSVLPQVVLDLIKAEREKLFGAFVVVQPSRIRISRRPKE